jgi:hypothetical protein
MSKNKDRGTRFETLVAIYLAARSGDPIGRETLHGRADVGDLRGVRSVFGPVAVEIKNHRKMALSGWLDEAETERGNADAVAGAVVHKRVGKGERSMGEQYVTLTLHDFAVLLWGTDVEDDE